MQAIREIARQKGVTPARLNKAKLITAIQKAEGNFDCFATPHVRKCNQLRCIWRQDCIAVNLVTAQVDSLKQEALANDWYTSDFSLHPEHLIKRRHMCRCGS